MRGVVMTLARADGAPPLGECTGRLTTPRFADPSTYTLISTAMIDAYFFLGGVLYGWAARTTAASGRSQRRSDSMAALGATRVAR